MTMPSYERHRAYLLEEMARKRGEEFVKAHGAMLSTSLRYLERQGKLLTDEEFEEAKRAGRPLAV